MGKLQGKIRRRIPGNASAGGIESWPIKIVTVFIRLASGKNAALDFQGAPDQSRSGDAEGYVRRILPVMNDRRVRIVHRRNAMHKGGRTERGLTRVAEINVARRIGRQF